MGAPEFVGEGGGEFEQVKQILAHFRDLRVNKNVKQIFLQIFLFRMFFEVKRRYFKIVQKNVRGPHMCDQSFHFVGTELLKIYLIGSAMCQFSKIAKRFKSLHPTEHPLFGWTIQKLPIPYGWAGKIPQISAIYGCNFTNKVFYTVYVHCTEYVHCTVYVYIVYVYDVFCCVFKGMLGFT